MDAEEVLGPGWRGRFWAKVRKSEGCWEWTASKARGYGQMGTMSNGRSVTFRAHRLSWLIHHGPVPAGMDVCHRCDNPACVRPDHLFVDTHRANLRDASTKGRTAIGGRNGRARLDPSAVAEIRSRVAAGEKSSDVALSVGVSYSHVRDIVNHRRWS